MTTNFTQTEVLMYIVQISINPDISQPLSALSVIVRAMVTQLVENKVLLTQQTYSTKNTSYSYCDSVTVILTTFPPIKSDNLTYNNIRESSIIKIFMGCNIQKSPTKLQKPILSEVKLIEPNEPIIQPLEISSHTLEGITIQQIQPSAGEENEQPVPTSPGVDEPLTPTFTTLNDSLSFSPRKSAIARRQTGNIVVPTLPCTRLKKVHFTLPEPQNIKPNLKLRRKYNIEDLF